MRHTVIQFIVIAIMLALFFGGIAYLISSKARADSSVRIREVPEYQFREKDIWGCVPRKEQMEAIEEIGEENVRRNERMYGKTYTPLERQWIKENMMADIYKEIAELYLFVEKMEDCPAQFR